MVQVKASEARAFGDRLASLVETGRIEEAHSILAPLLVERVPFTTLGRIGEMLGRKPRKVVRVFLDEIAAGGTMGGWVVIGSALGQHLADDPEGAFAHCRRYVAQAGIWYAADIFGERVPGPALVADFEHALHLLDPWRRDRDRWVRRTVGVAIHFWAKRSKGAEELRPQAKELLSFLEPMFSEWEIDAVKGVGWGLKTLGRHYPELLAAWLPRQVGRRHRALMLRKALNYLPQEMRQIVLQRREA